jgi:uncharacterized protein (DUF362 family)
MDLMKRRTFLSAAAAAPALMGKESDELPKYRIVSRYQPAKSSGMPGPYPAKVISLHDENVIDAASERVNVPVMREMMARGMRSLTGAADVRDAWARFIRPDDVVGIKVNCSGAPNIMSTPEVVGEIVRNLGVVGVKPEQIYIYERFLDQLQSVHYERHVAQGVNIVAVETPRRSVLGYDPGTYVEVNFFGEEDTRSSLVRLVAERFTKIINVPNMKDHGAAGVTGCLKNIAYGDFSNVARSHVGTKTHTYSFIGTLATVEPLRSKTVLQVMDGLRGVWQGGPFSPQRRYRFYPQRMMFGTDPVAIDRLLIDIIDNQRKKEGAISVWERTTDRSKPGVARYIREPGHIEYGSQLRLGEYDLSKIKVITA